jgi:hypothetical protein
MPRRHEATDASPVAGFGAAPVEVEAGGRVEVVPVGVARVGVVAVGVVAVGVVALRSVGVDAVGLVGVGDVELVPWAERALTTWPK